MQEYCPTEPGAHHLDLWRPAPDPRVAHLGSNAERPAERRMRSATSWPRYRVVAPSTQVGAATRGYQSVTRKRGHNAFAPLDREFVDDAAYIHLEIEALHRRAREMPGQTARGGCAADDLVGEERMDVKDRIDLGRGHVRPAEAERRHAQLYRSEQWTVWRPIRSLRKP